MGSSTILRNGPNHSQQNDKGTLQSESIISFLAYTLCSCYLFMKFIVSTRTMTKQSLIQVNY